MLVIVKLIAKWHALGGEFVAFGRPFAKVNQFATLTTKRAMGVVLPRRWRLAGGARIGRIHGIGIFG